MDPSGKPTGQLWDCSTAAKPKTAPPPPGPAALGAAGPQDLNCTRNPDFCTANQARIEMCSMDLLLGDRTIPNVNGTNGTTLNFKGRALLAASLTELGKLGLNKATHVVLTGETHAGTAALLVADEMARQLKLISPGLKVFKVLPADGMHPRFDSMFAQSLPGLTTLWMDQALQSMAALANVTGALNQDCVAANLPNESYKCLYFAEALSHVKTPTFGARGRLMTNNYRPATAFAAPAARRPGGALSTTCAAEAARGTSLTLWLSPPPSAPSGPADPGDLGLPMPVRREAPPVPGVLQPQHLLPRAVHVCAVPRPLRLPAGAELLRPAAKEVHRGLQSGRRGHAAGHGRLLLQLLPRLVLVSGRPSTCCLSLCFHCLLAFSTHLLACFPALPVPQTMACPQQGDALRRRDARPTHRHAAAALAGRRLEPDRDRWHHDAPGDLVVVEVRPSGGGGGRWQLLSRRLPLGPGRQAPSCGRQRGRGGGGGDGEQGGGDRWEWEGTAGALLHEPFFLQPDVQRLPGESHAVFVLPLPCSVSNRALLLAVVLTFR